MWLSHITSQLPARTEPKIYLVDFGSAVLGSGTRTAAGTFGYMAPESFGNSFTPKSDLHPGCVA